MTSRYDLAIFDFDGTLADSSPWFRTIVNTLARKHGFRQVDDAELEALRGQPSRTVLRELQIPLWKMPFIANSLRKAMAAEIDQIRLFDGVDQLLTTLVSSGVALAVATSNSEANVRQVLGARIAGMITHYACGVSLFGKGRIFRCVMKRFQSAPERTIAFGDEARDIEAARNAGIAAGAVTWGYAAAELLQSQRPDYLISSIDEIRAIVVPDDNHLPDCRDPDSP